MVFAVKDKSLLDKAKAGDKVKFDADNVNGQFVVTTIEKAK
jgi:Cu/Ag efflux protein CusF